MYIILKLFYLFSFIRIIRIVNGIDINNEKDFVENINNNKKEEQIFRIHNEIIINDKDILSPSIKNITIIGSTKEESIINFKNNDSINILFSKYCQSIFLKDITFIGNLQFIDNQNITFNNVNYNGYYIAEHTYEDEDNNSEIKVYDSNFILPNIRQGYEIKNWNIDIFRSNFYGNNQHEMYMIKFKSTLEQSNILKIDQTFFDGNFHNSALHCDYGSIIIYSSAFQKCYNGNNLKGGGAISFLNTDNTLYNITFENNYSDFAGGSIFLENTYSSNIDSINFYNSSSISGNTFATINNNQYNSDIEIHNIYQYGNCTNNYNVKGSIFSSSGSNVIRMTNFYGKNLCYGDVINVEGDGKIALSNFHVENIYFKYENSLIKTHNPQKNGPNVSLSSCSIKNLYQNFEFYSASLITINQGIVKFDNCNIDNINGIKMGLTSQENQGIVHFISTVINNIYSKYPEPIFYSKNYYKYFSEPGIYMYNTTLSNIFQDGVIFHLSNMLVNLYRVSLYNIHECYKTNSCNSFKEKFSETFDSSLLYHSSEIKITLNHCSFDHIYGKKGMKLNDGYISFKNSQIVNSYFENGFLYYPNNNNKEIEVSYNFENVTFSNNKSNKGTFLHISDVISGSKFLLDVRKSNFINNTAEYFGGVIYSEAKKDFSCYNLIFKNSIFEDNTAILGKISYVFDIEHEMLFFPTSLLDDLKSFNNNFVTNPTYLMFDEDYNNTIEIYSGDRIDQEYSSSIYDDYGNKFSLSDDISNSKIEDLIFYEMLFYGKKNEVLRSKIYGSTKSYCLNNSCKFKNLRLVGPPGDYVLELKIVGFGNYEEFLNNSIKLNVKIKECNEPGYIYQDKDGENIKSCYKPICNPKCSNQGVCINDNICDCSKTTYTGRICSERNRLGKNKIFNQIIYIISIGFIIVTIGSIYFVFHHRKNEIIKAASFNFMIIILIGLILNFIYVILLTLEITSYKICILLSVVNNLGFSLVFGSIISKTLRVYYIFTLKTASIKINGISNYCLIITLLIFHFFIDFRHLITKSVKKKESLTIDEMEYSECDYPHDERIRLIINFIIILIGCIWTYRMRYISHIFREPLAVPFYSYLIYKGIVFIMEIFCSNINNLSYLADSFGTILYSFIILYFLYFIKFYNIRFTLNKMDNRQHRASNVLTYIKQEKVFITSNYVMSSNVV